MALTKGDILQVLARLRTDDGRPFLAAGLLRDVLVEWHGDRAFVALVVESDWGGREPSPAERDRLAAAVRPLPQVAGVKTVVADREPGPRGPAESRSAREARREAALRRPQLPPPRLPAGTRIVAVASGKGGVGKSTVSVNLAVSLRRLGLRTALVDCDVYGFSVPMLIGLEEAPRVEERRIVPPRAEGVEVMSMDFLVRDNSAVVWRGPMLGKALRQFVEDVRWSDPEVMVLDLPPGTGDVALDVVTFFPDGAEVLVTTPDPFAARVAERAGRMAMEAGHRLVGVVENMSYARCPGCGREMRLLGKGGGDAVAHALGSRVLARIPFLPREDGGRHGLVDPGSEAGRAYRHLAEQVAEAVLART
ncbi:MAG: Mrp/NBP35 family ATP-binding protein [Clostridia bacterium]|nr:Mrp/NBP35 family ATP-binding protein [Clostridia bacterium]